MSRITEQDLKYIKDFAERVHAYRQKSGNIELVRQLGNSMSNAFSLAQQGKLTKADIHKITSELVELHHLSYTLGGEKLQAIIMPERDLEYALARFTSIERSLKH